MVSGLCNPDFYDTGQTKGLRRDQDTNTLHRNRQLLCQNTLHRNLKWVDKVCAHSTYYKKKKRHLQQEIKAEEAELPRNQTSSVSRRQERQMLIIS